MDLHRPHLIWDAKNGLGLCENLHWPMYALVPLSKQEVGRVACSVSNNEYSIADSHNYVAAHMDNYAQVHLYG